LPFFNGINHIQVLTKRFGARAVLGGVCYVSTTLHGDGAIEQLADAIPNIWRAVRRPSGAR
jgi:2-dehydropantoate 2-reductase